MSLFYNLKLLSIVEAGLSTEESSLGEHEQNVFRS
jgi:hypothetical protein